MLRKRRKLLIFAGGALLVATLFNLLARDREPSYQDRTLSQWHASWERAKRIKDQRAEAEAVYAIKQIGSNAVPFLLKRLERDYSLVPYKVSRIHWRLYEIISPLLVATNKAEPTSTFVILGPLAAPAVPDLKRFLHVTNNPALNRAAAYCLAAIGTEGLPPLLSALTVPSDPAFSATVHMLAVGSASPATNFVQAVPMLASSVAGPDHLDTIKALGQIGQASDIAIPALTARLNWTNPLVSMFAMQSILKFGPQHIPSLLTNQDLSVRQAATNSLRVIAPEFLSDAPTK